MLLKKTRLGLCFGLLTYLVVISAMAKPQEILIPSYKDPERHSMLQSEKKSSSCAYLPNLVFWILFELFLWYTVWFIAPFIRSHILLPIKY